MSRLIAFALFCLACSAWASDEHKLEKMEVRTDLQALERGAETVITMCTGCHSLKYIKYRDLIALGIAKDKVDNWRGSNLPGASIPSQMTQDVAVKGFGTIPPDLSLMAQARDGRANYLYSYLLGFYVTPEGGSGNHLFSGVKMPDVLGIAGAKTAEERAPIEEKARDVVSFLTWAADPHELERKKLGYYVIGYLVLLTMLLKLVKVRVWSRLRSN